jgi:hypothetical protein
VAGHGAAAQHRPVAAGAQPAMCPGTPGTGRSYAQAPACWAHALSSCTKPPPPPPDHPLSLPLPRTLQRKEADEQVRDFRLGSVWRLLIASYEGMRIHAGGWPARQQHTPARQAQHTQPSQACQTPQLQLCLSCMER